MLRIGVDVGGTNTDAALVDTTKRGTSAVIATSKVPSTLDVTSGVRLVLQQLLDKTEIDGKDLQCITIGTTYFLNALVGRDASKLRKVGVIRLASNDFTALAPPFVDFPPDLAHVLNGHIGFVNGGLNIDGTKLGDIQQSEILKQCKLLRSKGIQDIVVVATFSPIDHEHRQEQAVRDIILEQIQDANVICSSEVGRLGLLERENAAIMNASMIPMSQVFLGSLTHALQAVNLGGCALYLSCNDGTMVPAEQALSKPVDIVASGPSNSMIGASFIVTEVDIDTSTEQQDGTIVIDVGGSTTDAGVLLQNGYPRQASAYSKIAGTQVNFAMPDVESIGLGGGSIVRTEGEIGHRVAVSVGPDSVGHNLTSKALCFGGDIITATDIAVASGTAEIGTSHVQLEASLLESSERIMQEQLEELVDRVKTRATPLPLAVVGGGAILLSTTLKGTIPTAQSEHASVANAIGAALARLSTIIDRIYPVENGRSPTYDALIMERAIKEAKAACVEKGADSNNLQIVAQDLISISYISNKVRVVVIITGKLISSKPGMAVVDLQLTFGGEMKVTQPNDSVEIKPVTQIQRVDLATYRPQIVNREWIVSEIDLECLSIGCYILGCAGGGNPYPAFLQCREALRKGQTMKIVDVSDLPSSAILLVAGKMGSPMVNMDRPGGNLVKNSLKNMMTYLRLDSIGALVCVEVGGHNGIWNLIHGSLDSQSVPMIDGDLMGRAFPLLEQISIFAVGDPKINDYMPISLSSGDGTDLILQSCKSLNMLDRTLRAACVEMGCAAGVTQRPLTADEMSRAGILRSHSLAWRLGRAVKRYNSEQATEGIGDSLVREFGGNGCARQIFEGKIIATDNRLIKGHSYGSIMIEGRQVAIDRRKIESAAEDNTLRRLKITFKNENLSAELQSVGGDEILATVPDLIMVLDSRSGQAVGAPEYRYGLKVIVLAATSHPVWTTARGLSLVGPEAFGMEGVKYRPVGRYVEPRSVIDEFA